MAQALVNFCLRLCFGLKKKITGGAHERVLFFYPQVLKFQTLRAPQKLILLGIYLFLGLIPNRATILDIVQPHIHLSYIPQIPPDPFFRLPQISVPRAQTTPDTALILPQLGVNFQSPTHQRIIPKDHPTMYIKGHILRSFLLTNMAKPWPPYQTPINIGFCPSPGIPWGP
jgi:hypothetical protein